MAINEITNTNHNTVITSIQIASYTTTTLTRLSDVFSWDYDFSIAQVNHTTFTVGRYDGCQDARRKSQIFHFQMVAR